MLKEHLRNGIIFIKMSLYMVFWSRQKMISGRLQFRAFIYPSIDSKINLEINNGVLKNSVLMKDIAESIKESPAKLAMGRKNLQLLENRLNEISFSALKNEISIKNEQVIVPRMNIASSALNMNVSGTHDFSNEVDYRFDFKFRDLLTNDRDSEFGEIIDDGTGFRMFLKMTSYTTLI